ncbi:hypothetical protein ABPG72_022005 [Tetrahymena utriculariae]
MTPVHIKQEEQRNSTFIPRLILTIMQKRIAKVCKYPQPLLSLTVKPVSQMSIKTPLTDSTKFQSVAHFQAKLWMQRASLTTQTPIKERHTIIANLFQFKISLSPHFELLSGVVEYKQKNVPKISQKRMIKIPLPQDQSLKNLIQSACM